MKIEILNTKDYFNERLTPSLDRIYFAINYQNKKIYKLQKIENKYAFVTLENSNKTATGVHNKESDVFDKFMKDTQLYKAFNQNDFFNFIAMIINHNKWKDNYNSTDIGNIIIKGK